LTSLMNDDSTYAAWVWLSAGAPASVFHGVTAPRVASGPVPPLRLLVVLNCW
jgi:hypothetical protein